MKGSYIIWHLLATCLKVTSCLRQRQTVSSSRQPPEFINKPFNGWCNIISVTLHSFCDVMSLSCTEMHLSRWKRSRRRRSSASQMINRPLLFLACFRRTLTNNLLGSVAVEDKWSKHSMLLCQVPSCLVLVLYGVCAQRRCACVCACFRPCRPVRLYNIRVNVVKIERCRVNVLVCVGVCLLNISLEGDLRCVSSVTSCHLQWLPPTEKASWSLRVYACVSIYLSTVWLCQ